MMFCGRNFCADRNSLGYTPVDTHRLSALQIQNGIFDIVYATHDISKPYSSTIPDSLDYWDYNTIMMAFFDGNLIAGNVNYFLSQISHYRVKVRESGTYGWITLFEKPIEVLEDLNFDHIFKYGRAKTNYDFALVPVLNDIEGNLNINTIHSNFDGLFIVEKDNTYSTLFTVDMTTSKNRPNTIIPTLNRRYPYVFASGANNYYTGNISTEFIANNSDVSTRGYSDALSDAQRFRDGLMEFLQDGRAKILKHFDGRMWMISVVGTPSETFASGNRIPVTSFEWVEIGSCTSSNDLYGNGFIDVNVEGS